MDTLGDNYKGRERLVLTLAFSSFVVIIASKAYCWFRHPLLTYPDQAAYLAMAEMISQGKLPYVDLFEWNPPLIMYLSLIPVWLSKLLHMPSALAFNCCVLGLATISSALSLFVAFRYQSKRGFLLLLPMIFALAFFSQDLLVNSGEREHLFMLAYLPFFVLRSIVWQIRDDNSKVIPKSVALVCGILAGLGMALKPQFIASALVVELFFYCQNKSVRILFRPEIYAALAVFAAYLVGCLLLPRVVWDIYFSQVVPLYISGLRYSSETLIPMLRANSDYYWHFIHLILTLSMALALSRHSALIAPLAAFSLTFVFHYIYGAQSWPYRFLPMTAGLFMLDGLIAGLAINAVLARQNQQRLLGPVLACTMLTIAAAVAINILNVEGSCRKGAALFDLAEIGYSGKCLKTDLDPLFYFIVYKTKATDSVFFMGTGIAPGYPAILQSTRQQGSRYIFCILPELDYCLSTSLSKRWQDMFDLVLENYGSDIANKKPAMIIMQKRVVLDLLVQHNFISKYMSEYGLSGETEFHEIWVRR